MDTRFWGPDGWLLLHSITYFLPNTLKQNDKQNICDFFEITSKILPCKYCRLSMQKFMKQLPIKKNCNSRDNMVKWIYKLHNKVNNKLRKQGYCITDNPKFNIINNKFLDIKKQIEENKRFKLNNNNQICNSNSSYKKNKKVIKTKKVQKGYKNFTIKCNKYYDINDLMICNNYIGSIIFNYPNYINSCSNDLHYKEIVSRYENYFNYIIKYCYLFDDKLSSRIKNYLDKYSLNKILMNYEIITDENNNNKYTLDVNCKLKLYQWYFNLCKTINNNKESNQIDTFCRKFKKYIVKTCSNSKTINEKTKKLNTCRKLIINN